MDRLRFFWNLLAGQTDDELEELTLELVQPTHPSATRLTAPHDHGLDVLVPARDGERAFGWQAKNYTKRIYWTECENSVKRAVGHWKPRSITFVFPRRLTTKEIQDWEDFRTSMLEAHPSLEGLERFEGIAGALRDRKDIVMRLLQELTPGQDVTALAARAIASSRRASIGSLLDVTLAQAEAEADVDPAYDLQVLRGPSPAQRAEAEHEDVAGYGVELDEQRRPRLNFTWDDGDRRTVFTALPRDPAPETRVMPWFSDSPDGVEARHRARRELALGHTVELRGPHVGVDLERSPLVFDDLDPERDLRGGQLILEQSEPVPITLTITDADGAEHRLSVDAVLVPPLPGYHIALAGARSGIVITIDLLLGKSGRSLLGAEVVPTGVPAAELVGGLRFAQRFPGADLIRVDAPDVFDDPILDRGAVGSREDETVDLALTLARVAARIEAENGQTLDLPGGFTDADLHHAAALDVLLDGGASEQITRDVALSLPALLPTDPAAYDRTVTAQVHFLGHPTGLTLSVTLSDLVVSAAQHDNGGTVLSVRPGDGGAGRAGYRLDR